MTHETTGGPAFPNITPDMPIQGGPGMTLRDYFAAAALQGLLANHSMSGSVPWAALTAYRYADAMLAQRRHEAA